MQIDFQRTWFITYNDNAHLDKAPRLTIRRVIGILASDIVFDNSTNTSTNIEAAMFLAAQDTLMR